MVVAFIRHAHAGSRSAWTEDDRARPLSEKGRLQAQGLVTLLPLSNIVALIASPYLRCIQTLEPLGLEAGVPVTVDDRLAEDTPFEVTLSLLEHVDEGTVLCSHGDVIPATIGALVRRGLSLDGPSALKKGSTYLLHRNDGRFVSAEYLPPPTIA